MFSFSGVDRAECTNKMRGGEPSPWLAYCLMSPDWLLERKLGAEREVQDTWV